MIKAIIFDLDGTIADTIDDIKDALNEMLSELSFPLLTREMTLKNINHGAYELVRRSLPEKYRDDDSFIRSSLKTYEKYYSSGYNIKTSIYDGIKEAVSFLKNKGIKLAVLSNKQDEFVKNIIYKHFGEDTFDFVFGQGEFPPKPDPSSIRHIISKLGISPCEVVLVGDSHVDMQTAKAANVHSVGVTWGYRTKDVLIENGAEKIINTRKEIESIPDFNFICTIC